MTLAEDTRAYNNTMEGKSPEFLRVEVEPGCAAPFRATPSSAGYDLHSAESYVIAAGKRQCVRTGVKIALPLIDGRQTVAIIKSRSGSSFRSGIEVGAGVIDYDYRGEIRVILHNHGDDPFSIRAGDRIAQMLIMPVFAPIVVADDLGATVRGAGGFGSTGV